ncbi:hypothetical protein ACEQ8H_000203 [Pleosporales sp. CAS-2024a]
MPPRDAAPVVSSPPPPRWTMSLTLSRKRSRLDVPDAADDNTDDDDEQYRHARRDPSPALSDGLKRTRTQCELEDLAMVPASEAWSVDMDALLASRRGVHEARQRDNAARYVRGESLVVLCVQGNVQVHYELLCAALQELLTISPSLQAFVLCHDPATHRLSLNAPFSLPMIRAVEPANNHFVRLGLLHPLGGGKFPLDALVLLDHRGRRRLVLPFGWGAGKHAATPAGKGIQAQLMQLLRSCVETLEQER